MDRKEDTPSSSARPPPKRLRSSQSPQVLSQLVSLDSDKLTQHLITLGRLQPQRDQTSLATSRDAHTAGVLDAAGRSDVYASNSSQRSLVLSSANGHRGKNPVQEVERGRQVTVMSMVDTCESFTDVECPSTSVRRDRGYVRGGSSLRYCSNSGSIQNNLHAAGTSVSGELMLQSVLLASEDNGTSYASGQPLFPESSRAQCESNPLRTPNEVCRSTQNSEARLDDLRLRTDCISTPNVRSVIDCDTNEESGRTTDGFVPRVEAEVVRDRSLPQSRIISSRDNLQSAGGDFEREPAASRQDFGDVVDNRSFPHERNSGGFIYTRTIADELLSSEIERQPVSHQLQGQASLDLETSGNAHIGQRLSNGMHGLPTGSADPGSSSRDVESHPRVLSLPLRASHLNMSEEDTSFNSAAESLLPHSGIVENSIVQPAPPVNIREEPSLTVEIMTAAKDLSVDTKVSDDKDSNESDTLTCPICMEPWTNSGDHQICSLACGHLFGKSCIRRWLQQSGRRRGKCPHCNKRAKLEDLCPLYVPRIAVADAEGQQLAKEVHALRAENLELKAHNAKLLKELSLAKENQGRPDHDVQRVSRTGGQTSSSALRASSSLATIGSHGDNFVLQNEVPIHGGKVFDIDADSQIVIIANKTQGCVSSFGLIKMSLLACTEVEKISFPSGFGAIRDIRLSSNVRGPGKLALVASIGKKLSIISQQICRVLCTLFPIISETFESNNIVLTYSLQSPPWSCTWDPCFPNQLFSGLQDGSLAMFDLRQTKSPVALLKGSSTRPIHTLQPVPDLGSSQEHAGTHQPGSRGILGASSSGVFFWNLGSSSAPSETVRPDCIFARKERVCVSLAYEGTINAAVVSLRQSPLVQSEASLSCTPESSAMDNSSQSFTGLSQSGPPMTTGVENCHCIFARNHESPWPRPSNGEVSVTGEMSLHRRSHWRWVGEMVGRKSSSVMSRTAIVSEWKSTSASKSLFASGDEDSNAVMLWDMQSCRIKQTLGPHRSRVLDIKNVQITGKDLMGCVSDSTFQLYQRKAMTR